MGERYQEQMLQQIHGALVAYEHGGPSVDTTAHLLRSILRTLQKIEAILANERRVSDSAT